MLAVFAEFEREVLREGVRAGLAQARQNGKTLGRPVTAAGHYPLAFVLAGATDVLDGLLDGWAGSGATIGCGFCAVLAAYLRFPLTFTYHVMSRKRHGSISRVLSSIYFPIAGITLPCCTRSIANTRVVISLAA
jgi:hypothetical protein